MQRRECRQRSEYLYRRANQAAATATASKKKALSAAVASGSRVDTSLKRVPGSLLADLLVDEHQTVTTASVDDEYANAVGEPRCCLTTSRSPSTTLLVFAKEFSRLLPGCQRINRGGYVLADLLAACKANGITDLLLLHEHRGVPAALTVTHLPHGPTARFSLHNVVSRADCGGGVVGTVSEAHPHLIFAGFSSELGKRTVAILQHLFPAAVRPDCKRVVTFAAGEDGFISLRHHIYRASPANGAIELAEAGPRLDMRLFRINSGSCLQEEDEAAVGATEWQLPSFTNTAAKKAWL